MRIALFSDIHGNLDGLRAVWTKLNEIGGADVYVAAGDFLGGSGGTEDVLDFLLEHNVHMLRGNGEDMYLNIDAVLPHLPAHWQDYLRQTTEWLHRHVSASYWELLAALPLSETFEVAPGRRLLVCHAAPDDPWKLTCAPDAPLDELRATYGPVDAEIVAHGHFHFHHVMPLDRKLLINVASVGLREDCCSALTVLEFTDRWIVEQCLVQYDVHAEIKLMKHRKVPKPWFHLDAARS